ncbi:ovarian-specific serine/threonine-protein kinase lok-related [Anaeramoeba flamelloides]|uniref:Ovarian-specific serine/threonine-protein kinase lok-related n=1 Tax=Anaeramoeba flamelloides TaxID=1746091 RepID=A0AAV7Y612_9EUKA|nr:ovarian-specific serine/threonine-protein kinase lok-related [Anaeramoeba flamelloides]
MYNVNSIIEGPDFITEKEIGKGSYAIVYKGKIKSTGKVCAVKAIDLTRRKINLKKIYREIKLMKSMNHQNIVKLYDTYRTKECLYIIMEYCGRGDLDLEIQKRLHFDDLSAKKIFRQIVSALKYMHEKLFIHRDIKPQNILLCSPKRRNKKKKRKKKQEQTESGEENNFEDDLIVKLADFGLARDLPNVEVDLKYTKCGTPLYMAPEILEGKEYSSKVDLWSAGAVLYQMLTGSAPFVAFDLNDLKQQFFELRLKGKPIEFPENIKVSTEAKDYVNSMLKINPKERISFEKFITHKFLDEVVVENENLNKNQNFYNNNINQERENEKGNWIEKEISCEKEILNEEKQGNNIQNRLISKKKKHNKRLNKKREGKKKSLKQKKIPLKLSPNSSNNNTPLEKRVKGKVENENHLQINVFPSESIFHQNQYEEDNSESDSYNKFEEGVEEEEEEEGGDDDEDYYSKDNDNKNEEIEKLKINKYNDQCINFVKSLRNFKPNIFTYQLYQMKSRVKVVKHLADKISKDDQSKGLVIYIKISKFLITFMEKADNFVLNNELEESKKHVVIEQMAALKRLFNTCYQKAKKKSGLIKLMTSLKFTETRVIDPVKIIYEKTFELLNEAKKHHLMNSSNTSKGKFGVVKYLLEFLLLDEEFSLRDLCSIYQLYLEIPVLENNL